ncbi:MULTISPECIES: hypothetical protein [Bradyrhizobium]|uniref:CBS domain-containing protein n=1 Tax=Bradyrhizobium yuanmingense TaxID=108015 RepID=A0A1C3TYU5_9BRAD|nr:MULTISPECIES: hypothetical protein [Bradyrhizobium]MCA1381879.1 hypothetical protein [Bradyrhizobium sp. BRP05]MCA1417444.1 hypothetical protein [Bradyrhizobium sp. BRP23]TWI30634.1 hypothetical protein IQ15_01529 [Bradyrhizobium yuanmingense]SCB08308.1 hypothetical protein GA0061099_1001231 [Bradyrhizobium yuanmingense]
MSESNPPEAKPFKDRLAWTVFLCSFFGAIFIATLLINKTNTEAQIDKVFSALLPLFGTWAGTILAFYFARENFDSANQSVQRMVNRLTPDQQLAQVSVRQAMKPFKRIEALSDPAPETKFSVRELKEKVEEGNTRVPIFADQKALCVVHEGTLNKYLVSKLSSGSPVADLSKIKLSEFLSHKLGNEEIRSIVTKFAVVKMDASLADARDEMLKIKGAQDVFVTASGSPSEKVEGWLTNSDITRDLN